ncbi:phosphatidylinositol 4-kinase alpha 1-like isoform X1 [Olea europaea subsp. europaea]|uniref:Phosphatidylinositol 4-kinase alpha 1-like isoform X1 n=1 Tax=Olea europaea subsp. europaea TaxID=158383 RepID=A0A8S0QF08_OLEEU|nr:phosphatidylinositol 4-kinase alpha 1-like isoform X1 [Olea europaea subsp. europaea]
MYSGVADFLGPLLPAGVEICSDFDPSGDVEPSVLKQFRNLWFYIALFGLAPPIQKTKVMTKSVSTTFNSVGSMGTIALQAVGVEYAVVICCPVHFSTDPTSCGK